MAEHGPRRSTAGRGADQATARQPTEPDAGAAFDGLVRLTERAQVAGVLRADFSTQDIVVVLMANAGLVERTPPGIAADASARLVHVLLDGFRAAAATDGPPAPSGCAWPCVATANAASAPPGHRQDRPPRRHHLRPQRRQARHHPPEPEAGGGERRGH